MDYFERVYIQTVEKLIKKDPRGKTASIFGAAIFISMGAFALLLTYLSFCLYAKHRMEALALIIGLIGGAFSFAFIFVILMNVFEFLTTSLKSFVSINTINKIKSFGNPAIFIFILGIFIFGMISGLRSCNKNESWEIKVDPSDSSYWAERRIWLGLVKEQVPAKRHGDDWYVKVEGKWVQLYYNMLDDEIEHDSNEFR